MSASNRQLDGAKVELGAAHEQAIRKARQLLASAENRYTRAQKRAAAARGASQIDAAFDEVDRAQSKLIWALRRVRELQRGAGEPESEAVSNVTLPTGRTGAARRASRPKRPRVTDPGPKGPRAPAA